MARDQQAFAQGAPNEEAREVAGREVGNLAIAAATIPPAPAPVRVEGIVIVRSSRRRVCRLSVYAKGVQMPERVLLVSGHASSLHTTTTIVCAGGGSPHAGGEACGTHGAGRWRTTKVLLAAKIAYEVLAVFHDASRRVGTRTRQKAVSETAAVPVNATAREGAVLVTPREATQQIAGVSRATLR